MEDRSFQQKKVVLQTVRGGKNFAPKALFRPWTWLLRDKQLYLSHI